MQFDSYMTFWRPIGVHWRAHRNLGIQNRFIQFWYHSGDADGSVTICLRLLSFSYEGAPSARFHGTGKAPQFHILSGEIKKWDFWWAILIAFPWILSYPVAFLGFMFPINITVLTSTVWNKMFWCHRYSMSLSFQRSDENYIYESHLL